MSIDLILSLFAGLLTDSFFFPSLDRINAPASLFSSNYEDRALALRKLSFVIFCGSQDQYVSQLPVLQEKIVDTLKTNNSLLLTEVTLIVMFLKLVNRSSLANLNEQY